MLRTFFLILNIGCAFLLALTYIIPYLNPIEIRKIPLLGLFYPLLILTNIFFIVGWALTKRSRSYMLISLLVILLGIQHLGAIVGTSYFNSSKVPIADRTKISSYNIKNFAEIHIKKGQFQPDAIKNINKHIGGSQYFCVQEIGYTARQIISKELDFPHSFGNKGTRIFSKKPFIETGKINFNDSGNSCSWADVPVQNKIVRLYNIHLESNHITKDATGILNRQKHSFKEKIYLLKGIFVEYTRRSRKRVQQTEILLQHISESPYPVIVCGDFNDAPISYIYNRFTSQLRDGFRERGKGLGFTFRGSIPFLRIDYILADDRLHFENYQTIKTLTYSDHFPVTAEISLP